MPKRPQIEAIIIVALLLLVCIPSLFTRDLWNPDEPRYTQVGLEMIHSHEFFVPHLNGDIYSDKPPLFFWLTALVSVLGGGLMSGRIVTLLAVGGILAALYGSMRGFVKKEAALLSAGMFLGTGLMLHFAKLGVIDPLLSLLEAGAILLGWIALQRRRRNIWPWLGCYGCMGLGTLTKGPVAIAIPLLVLAVYAVADRRKIRLGGWSHAAGLLLMAGIIGAWVLPAINIGGEAYRETILLKQTAGRLGKSFGHQNPFHFYISGAPGLLFPWALFLPLAIVAAYRNWRQSGNGILVLLISWSIIPVLFFSCLSSKRVHYIVPVIPAIAALCAWYFTTQFKEDSRLHKVEQWLMNISLLLCTALAIGGMAAAIMTGRSVALVEAEYTLLNEYFTPTRTAAALVLLLIPLSASIIGLRTSSALRVRKAVLLVCAMLAFSPAIDFIALPAINRFKSAREFSRIVAKEAGTAENLKFYGGNYAGLYNLYTGFPVVDVLWTPEDLQRALNSYGGCILARDEELDRDLTDYADKVDVLASARIGHSWMQLIRSRTAESTDH